jgi:hypothetical protein
VGPTRTCLGCTIITYAIKIQGHPVTLGEQIHGTREILELCGQFLDLVARRARDVFTGGGDNTTATTHLVIMDVVKVVQGAAEYVERKQAVESVLSVRGR